MASVCKMQSNINSLQLVMSEKYTKLLSMKKVRYQELNLAATAVLLPLHCIVASKSGYPAHLVSPTHLETSRKPRKVPPNVFVDHTVNHGRKDR